MRVLDPQPRRTVDGDDGGIGEEERDGMVFEMSMRLWRRKCHL